MRRFLRSLVVLVAATLVLSACSSRPAGQPAPGRGDGSAAATAQPNRLVIAQTRDADNLDPAKTTQLESYQIIVNIFDRLVELDENLQFRPGLAESWEAEGNVWWFKLRKGVKATNGEEMNADAVKFTFDRILDPATKSPQVTRLAAF